MRQKPVKRAAVWLVMMGGAFAQDAADSFEVASIKPADPDHAMAISRSGNRIAFSNYSLEMLVLWAYNIRSDRLIGQPKGIDSARYDIAAAAPQITLVPGQLNRMMQSLLADRFKLVVHHETREITYYAMVADNSGPKVHIEPITGPMGQNPFSMTANGHLTGTKVTPDMLAKVLTNQLGRFVEDRTDLKGVFDFTLNWAPDTLEDNSRDGPSIFTAIREQLGFRLESRKGPVEVIVIDRVETGPSAN